MQVHGHTHTRCQGRDTSRSEEYTRTMAKLVVRCLTSSSGPHSSPSMSASKPRALSAIQLDPSSEEAVDLSYASQDDLVDGTGHRPLEQTPTKFLGLVTKVIPARSPEFHSKRGKKAIDDEVSDLRSATVWDEDSVAEWSQVRHIKKDGIPYGRPPLLDNGTKECRARHRLRRG